MSDRTGTLLLIADADPTMGIGHVARCAALGEGWQRAGGRAIGAGHLSKSLLDSNFGDRVRRSYIQWEPSDAPGGDVRRFDTIIDRFAPQWVVLDGYHFSEAMVAAVREKSDRLAIVDDSFRLAGHEPDVLLIPSPDAAASYHPLAESMVGLLGPRFLPLSSDFCADLSPDDATRDPTTRRIVVLAGGSDPAQLTETVLDAVERLDVAIGSVGDVTRIELLFVVGPANPRLEQLTLRVREFEQAARDENRPRSVHVELLSDVARPAMLMRGADLAISAAGGTCWELAVLQVPTLLITTAENQRPAARWLEQHGAAIYLGDLENLSADSIAASLQMRLDELVDKSCETTIGSTRVIDGRGADRAVTILRELTDRSCKDPCRYRIRPVRADDAPALWRLANAPSIRSRSTHRNPITPSNHRGWFFERLEDPENCRIWMLDLADLPVGSIRYQRRVKHVGAEALISIQIAAPLRGRGLGTHLMQSTLAAAAEALKVERLTAFVYRNNRVSARCFEKLGFRRMEPRCTRQKICFELPADDALKMAEP